MQTRDAAAHGMAISEAWCAHFAANQPTAEAVPWDGAYRLTGAERKAIEKSIQQFQLGEGAEGRRLLARGQAYAQTSGDSCFTEALALFIKEEQRHSRQLLRFMQLQGIRAVEKHWVDSAFRRVRDLAGLELELRVLVTAEIIAVPYYRALSRATGSQLLRSICEVILTDESAHLKFQKSMLSRLGTKRAPGLRCLVWVLHRLFLAGTCFIVWIEHCGVFKAAGYCFGKFLEEALSEMSSMESPTQHRPSHAAVPGSGAIVPEG